jgi:hypothetical protein
VRTQGREVGAKRDPRVSPELAPVLRRQFEAICVGGPAPFDRATGPTLTRDPTDDAIVYTALLADAAFLISDDRDIVPDGDEHTYEHGGHRVLAVRFGRHQKRLRAITRDNALGHQTRWS